MPATLEKTAVERTKVEPRPLKKTPERLKAPFSLRCGAILIDYIILVAVLAFSTLVARMMGGGARTAGNSSETAGILIAIALGILNLGVLAGLTGLTIGKWTTGLRIERKDGSPLGIGRAMLRHFIGYPLSLLPLGGGFALAALGSRGRALHDLIAGTIVVRDAPVMPRRP
ncbi:MAG TPA: RDD family protein [Pyrinomonadaceae bacterium]|jgi:uncharacterized RDD family membrane protein YckC